MNCLLARIARVKSNQIGEVLNCVIKRYNELFPDWDVSAISLEKKGDRNEQLSRIISVLESMKNME